MVHAGVSGPYLQLLSVLFDISILAYCQSKPAQFESRACGALAVPLCRMHVNLGVRAPYCCKLLLVTQNWEPCAVAMFHVVFPALRFRTLAGVILFLGASSITFGALKMGPDRPNVTVVVRLHFGLLGDCHSRAPCMVGTVVRDIGPGL